MNEDTRLEVIKALAYGVDVEDIANMAETDTTAIEKIRHEHDEEIRDRIREAMGYGY